MSKEKKIESETITQEGSSQQYGQNTPERYPETGDEVFFIILRPSEQQINFENLEFLSNITPEIFYNKPIKKEDKSFLEEIVFKFKRPTKEKEKGKKKKSSSNNYEIQYIDGDYTYIILFSLKDESFIYEAELKKRNKYLPELVPEDIDQNIIPLYNKLFIFLEALENKKVDDKYEKLYKDTIGLYEKKKKFSLLIPLFLQIYENYNTICKDLIKIFYDINEKENSDRPKDIAKYLDDFTTVFTNSDDLVKNNKYDEIQFYGLLFCYLAYYDKEKFPKLIMKFSEGNADILFEILIIYYSHITNSLNQDKNFYDRFIKYCLKKEKNSTTIFKRILNYIDDIEIFLSVINENVKTIFEKYEDLKNDPIQLSSGLKLTKKKLNKDYQEKKPNEKKKTDIKNELDIIENLIKNIISYSKENSTLAVYIKDTFWIQLLKEYDIPDWENINNCFKLRKLFKEYNNLINILFHEETKPLESKKKKKENTNQNIKENINRYFERDAFAFTLNQNIKDFFEIKKGELSNSEILGAITWFNPYFSKEPYDKEKFKNYRETYIFDYIDFRNVTKEFELNFRNMKFEEIFETNIRDFINKITSKIKDILTFGNIIKLIDVKSLGDKKTDFYNILKDKYEHIIKDEIQTLKEDKLDNAVKIVSEFVSKIFLDEKDTNFLEDKINRLDDEIKKNIYYELIKKYNTKDYERMKNYIFEIFLRKKEDTDSIIKLIDNLSENDKKDFDLKLMQECKFDKEQFYSNNENKSIKLLCCLNEKGKLKKIEQGNKYANQMIEDLDDIRYDLEKGTISKKKLETFLNKIPQDKNNETSNIKNKNKRIEEKNNGKNSDKIIESQFDKNEKNRIIIQKLGLIKLTLEKYDPVYVFNRLEKIIIDLKEKVEKLNFIKESLLIFFRNQHRDDISRITNIINDIETKNICELKNEEMDKSIDKLLKLQTKCDTINKVKDFLLFKELFKISQGTDQGEIFEEAIKKLNELKKSFEENSSNIEAIFNNPNFKNIFKSIKEELGKKDESKSDLFIAQMIDYFVIKEKTKKEELKIIIKSKKYEMVIKSIRDFFINIEKKLTTLPEDIELSKMDLKDLKRILNDLKSDNIYDYQNNSPFYLVYTSFYNKKEAIDFLLKKADGDINKFEKLLKGKLDPTNRSITVKDIDDTIDCIKHFNAFKILSNSQIITYIKQLYDEKDKNQTTIKIFESFSKKFESIIELERKNEKDIFEDVYQIIQDASLICKLDSEDFLYKKDILKNGETTKAKVKINIEEKDVYEIKCHKLLFFKSVISNLEIIYDKINILRTEGFNIPIIINIIIKYPDVEYKLNDSERTFNNIKEYLFTVKNDYETQLTTIYENDKYLRLLYGKLFRKVKLHQEGNCEILEIMRYILNKTNYTDKIKDGKIYNDPIGEDFEDEYKESTKTIFNSISKYVTSLFKENKSNLETHYENMKIKTEKNNRGIYLEKCVKISAEEKILNIFMEKIEKLPIAQNILICGKETSIEEIQSFFYRAILCEYNNLFIVEILYSFSNFQHNKMYGYIDKLLSSKYEKAKKENKENKNIDKSRSKDYLDSCIVFVYEKLENEEAFKKELEKYTKTKEQKETNYLNTEESIRLNDESLKNIEDQNISGISAHSKKSIKDMHLLNNIKVISSDYCGLGKSFKIKKMINEDKKKYYHFPLGGLLTKKTIFEKINNLFKKIKNDALERKDKENLKDKIDDNETSDNQYSEFNNIAIHLDLIESEETSLINEFLFSFLITKFYTNNEDILYIPNNFKIYIEIPNSFEDYLVKYGILNAFHIENIVIGELRQNENSNITNIPMLELDLDLKKDDQDTKKYFKKTIEKSSNKEIEKFIKDNIGITKYSYHQINTFIKLFISNFMIFDGKLIFSNSQGDNITEECIKHFANSTRYFTNGGFAKLIMNYSRKKEEKNGDNKEDRKDKFDFCLDAYQSDFNENSKIPLIFIDKKKKKFNYEILPEIDEEKNLENIECKKNINKEVDIVYLIDATGSMNYEINAAKENVIQVLNQLKKNYEDYDFQFGTVFYRDKIDVPAEKDDYFPLTKDMHDLKNKISKIKGYGGGDGPEDWVGGYDLALNKMGWRDGIKLIIHIADAGAHGTEFSKGDRHPDQGKLLPPLIERCAKENINIIGFKINDHPERSFEKIREIYNDYKLHNKDNGQFIEIYEFERKDEKAVSENFKKLVMEASNQVINPSIKFLKRLKKMLYITNEVDKDVNDKKSLVSILNIGTDNYVITEDNYKKMVLLVYRIKANVPVIIMGETGCGKTSLIIKLSQLLNNGKILVEKINIHPGITDQEISKKMEEINAKAKGQEYIDEKNKGKKKELWIFFDEINTCLSLSLLTEIFINRSFNGEKLEENIRLIGACNPYRKRTELSERCGLTRENDKDDILVYKVEQLPLSLLYYVFSFGSLKNEDEKKYIRSIIQKLFNEQEDLLCKLTTEAISKCHIFLRDTFKDPSVVSLREIARFTKCVEFFQDYFLKKNNQIKDKIDEEIKKLYKIKSIICSIYLCYYIRLTDDGKKGEFDFTLQKTLLKIVNVYCEGKNKEEKEKEENLLDKIKYVQLKDEIREYNIKSFSDLLKIEEDYLIEQIDPDKGIGRNQILKENLFLLFLAVVTKIPLIIIGKPGTGKSLSAQLIYNSMKGRYSKKPFFLKYPQIIQIYFQGSESTFPEDVEELFKKAEGLYANYKSNNKNEDTVPVPIYMILFDELGLAEKSPTNPLKVLHYKLEYDGKNEGVCFIGISNYSLDAAKINRALSISAPNLEDKLDQIKKTAQEIAKSIIEDFSDNIILIFNILSRAYYLYKQELKFIKEMVVLNQYKKKHDLKGKNYNEIKLEPEFMNDLKKEKNIKSEFHGNRDFYNLIKGVAKEGSKLTDISDSGKIVPIINKYIERNFGGISYEIDIDFTFLLDNITKKIEQLEDILKEKIVRGKKKKNENKEEQKNVIKVTSVFLFKKIFNEACNNEENKKFNIKGDIYKIKMNDLEKYDLNDCIKDNINDNNSRYLLLEIKSNLAPLIIKNITYQNSYNKDITSINGSPFLDDNNNEYKAKKVNDIQNYASQDDKIIILQNLNPIQPYLYDLYNMNYKIIDDQKFARICLENFSEQLTPVNDSFRIIILVDKKFVNSVDMAFLNRLEKMQISFKDLLDKNQTTLIKKISEEIRLKKEIISEQSKINYDLNNLLINCSEQEIGGLVYDLFMENKKEKNDEGKIEEIKKAIYTKISILLPQDIITILPEGNIIKKYYFDKKKYYNFESYIKSSDATDKKISIIYTFSNIINTIKGYDDRNEFWISEIKSEEKLRTYIDDIKNKKQGKKKILIKFESFNSNKIQFITDSILHYFGEDDYNYIFIIYLKRNINNINSSSKERIYSIPNIYPNINQLFIDNLNGPEIRLKDILENNIKDVMFSAGVFKNLDQEFKDTLINFVYNEMGNKSKINLNKNSQFSNLSFIIFQNYGDKNEYLNEETYSDDIINYMLKKDIEFKNNIINKAKELIETDKDAQGDCYSLIHKMFREKYINKDNIDLISCILDYIKENIFKKNLEYIFKSLEHNNFLTTLLKVSKDNEIRLDKNDKSIIPNNRIILKYLKMQFLNEIKKENDNVYEPKFLFNYKIPGFYNFYKKFSEYLDKEIISAFFINEKILREYFDNKPEIIMSDFHDKEKELLNKVLENLKNDRVYFDLLNKITPDLILEDYITFYLEKHLDFYSKDLYKIIDLLLKLRFTEEKDIIKSNKDKPINIVILKIMWLESNSNYVESILSAFIYGKDIDENNDGLIFYQSIYDSIYNKKCKLKYIVNEKRNPEHTREVNECFYIILAGLCLSITSHELTEITIGDYCGKLKDIDKILQNLNDDLYLFLNELYIIKELIKIIDYILISGKKFEDKIREYIIESAIIIQKDPYDKISQLIENFVNFNKLLKKYKDKNSKTKYYETLKFIYKNEIKKINDIAYRALILEEIIKENEILKESNDIFHIILSSYMNLNDFKYAREDLLKSDNKIIQLIDQNLSDDTKDYHLSLSETLIYYFELNSLIYIKSFPKIESFEKDPLDVFKDCSTFLFEYKMGKIKGHGKLKNVTKLFCLGYIKSFCYSFIMMHNKPKFKPDNIIQIINEYDKINMIKLYIYKIIYNKNNKQISAFLKSTIKDKYKLKSYNNFEKFITPKDERQIIYDKDKSDNENYRKLYEKLEEYSKEEFSKEIILDDIGKNGKVNFDDFYKASYNLILSNLSKNDFENETIYINFYQNIVDPLFNNNEKLITLLQILFKKEKYEEIKNLHGIIPEDIEALLYGYRYCLNEINDEYEEGDYIYSSLYEDFKLDYLDTKFYPGMDTKEEPYYELYNQIEKHFKEKNGEGCYICLCEKGYYHSILFGFPGYSERNIKCPKCQQKLGATEELIKEKDETENKYIYNTIYKPIKRNNYFRIFKDEDEIDELKGDKNKYHKLREINYMTLKEFKEKHIKPLYENEQGLNRVDINYFRKENKIIRNLSQISYRLLNYILYCHLFFAKLYTNSDKFDNYLPKGVISWFDIINECFKKLKNELEKKGIKQVEIFMNEVYKELFNKLHDKECINSYEELIEFENDLEKLIQDKFMKAKEDIDNYKEFEKNKIKEQNSALALLKEIYTKGKYDRNIYPYYEHFYYTDYLDEEFINNILKNKNKNDYPVLVKYLEYYFENKDGKKSKKKKNVFSLENLALFNNVLKLFNDKYSNQISREVSEKQEIKGSEIYIENENSLLINNFIKLYNNFNLEDVKEGKLELNVEKNKICDFLLVDDNKYGRSYKKIYRKFINEQNKELGNLLEKKYGTKDYGIGSKIKINIQQIKEDEIFVLPKKFNFIKVIFNISYRKVISTQNYDNYNEYEINLEEIEKEMTDLLLKNKKLLNNDLIDFSYNNEVFDNQIDDLITNFKYNITDINIDDKVIIYNFIKEKISANNNKIRNIINNFITLIEYLNKMNKEENNKITEEMKIYEIDIIKSKKNISEDFQILFKDKHDLTVGKITNIFDYYLKLIFKYVKEDIEKYQDKYDVTKNLNINDKKNKNMDEKVVEEKPKLDKEIVNILDKIFKSEDFIIKREELSDAIRKFITLVLYREKEKNKDKKIKYNKKNIIEYLKRKDLWEKDTFGDRKFEENLLKIKEANIKIKEILYFYYYLINKDKSEKGGEIENEDEKFEKEVEEYIKNNEEKERIKRKIDEERNREEKTNVGTVIQTKVDQPEEEEEEEESSEKEEPTRVRKIREV